jgi:cell shape-determining protein MreC
MIEQQNQAIQVLNNRLADSEKENNRLSLMLDFEKSESAEWKKKFNNLVRETKGV